MLGGGDGGSDLGIIKKFYWNVRLGVQQCNRQTGQFPGSLTTPARFWPHNSGRLQDVVHGDVTIVIDVLDLLSVPWDSFKALIISAAAEGTTSTSA